MLDLSELKKIAIADDGGSIKLDAGVTVSELSSEFRVYSSLTRQTDQESPISRSWRATGFRARWHSLQPESRTATTRRALRSAA